MKHSTNSDQLEAAKHGIDHNWADCGHWKTENVSQRRDVEQTSDYYGWVSTQDEDEAEAPSSTEKRVKKLEEQETEFWSRKPTPRHGTRRLGVTDARNPFGIRTLHRQVHRIVSRFLARNHEVTEEEEVKRSKVA
ncbi:hypothetical protein PIB30_083037 [Stylosanthes scabra]|uniref:Uncharacterized protein n=1 Tax=Stylosanthes scabra TaxID=79078 RepID=A0ABU6WRU4_9FABA|nr:hypothetical protein [Stylosanthes scabra]